MNRQRRREGSLWASWSLSILLHVAIVGVVAGTWYWTQRTRPPEPIGITGGVVTPEQLAERLRPPREPVPAPVFEEPLPEPEPESVLEPEPEPVLEELPPEEDPAVLQADA